MGLVGQRHHKSGVVWGLGDGWGGRGPWRQQAKYIHPRQPSRENVKTTWPTPVILPATLLCVHYPMFDHHPRVSRTMLKDCVGIVSLDACFDFGYTYIYIFHIHILSFRIVVFDVTRKNLAARNLVDYYYALYFSCFHEWRDYVLGSRISTIVEKAS